MSNLLKKLLVLETAFDEYTLNEILGEGGAGRVYGGYNGAKEAVAIKILTKLDKDKRKRFKNETGFLAKNKHPNIVTVLDHGLANSEEINGPFYVMQRYTGSLRSLVGKLPPKDVMTYFRQVLDGVEAAHLQGATHRDIKPENILFDEAKKLLAVADFGVASFTGDQVFTRVETGPNQRLANFQYAAPEQRNTGITVGIPADIFALGLMLNEMFTSTVPHGVNYKTIASVSSEFSFLDQIIDKMLHQDPAQRPDSISVVKQLIQKYQFEAVSLQRISELKGAIIPIGEIDDPHAYSPPKVIGANWLDGWLTLTLDNPVSIEWINSLKNMGSFASAFGVPPTSFEFNGSQATVNVRENDVQAVIDYFKDWLQKVTPLLKQRLQNEIDRKAQFERNRLEAERKKEETRLKVNQNLVF
jgi:serine/threonine protein kinase